jgi:hypothetical protein
VDRCTNQFGGRCVVAQRYGILRTGVELTGARINLVGAVLWRSVMEYYGQG